MDIALIKKFVTTQHQKDQTGHDLHHIERVVKMAYKLSLHEGLQAHWSIIQAAAWLHDVSDDKLTDNVIEARQKIINVLHAANASSNEIDEIMAIIDHQSFSANRYTRHQLSPAGQIVQDADRLDALGAIGIARTMMYGASQRIPLYQSDCPIWYDVPIKIQASNSIVDHFYEKLLHLGGLMNTKTAKLIAQQRINFMKKYLQQLEQEVMDEL